MIWKIRFKKKCCIFLWYHSSFYLIGIFCSFLLFSKLSAQNIPVKIECAKESSCICNRTVGLHSLDINDIVKKIENSLENNDIDSIVIACGYHQIAIKYDFYLEDYPKSIFYNKKAEAIRLKKEDGLLWKSYQNLGINYYNLDLYKKAYQFFKKALEKRGNKEAKDSSNIYRNLAECSFELGDIEDALSYGKKSLTIKIDPKSREKISVYSVLALILLNSNDSTEIRNSIDFSNKALTLSIENSDTANILIALNNLLNANENLFDFEKSIQHNKKALKFAGNDTSEIALLKNNLANAYTGQKKYHKANETLNESLALLKQYYIAAFDYDYSAYYENIADNYTALQKLDTALLNYQKALINLTNNFRTEDILQNPNPKDTLLFIYSNPDMIRVLHLKATAAHEYYQQNQNQKYLTLANQTYQTAFNFHNQLQQDISTENSRLFQAKNILSYIENALKVTYELQENGQNVYESAFRFMEKNKATVLLQAMNEADALQFANLPDSLLEKEKDLKIALTYYNKQLNEAMEYEEVEEIDRLNNLLFEEKQQYSRLINQLENKYPEYYKLKYQQNLTKLTEVQNTLNDQTALLEYFVGDSSIYILSIQKNKSQLYQIKKPGNWKQTINNFRQSITDIDLDLPELFVENAHRLYQWLLNEPLCDLPENITQLQIIPDAELNYLPFEILLTEAGDEANIQYQKLPYLLQSKSVGYGYSAALLLENKQIKTAQKALAYGGYAPKYFDKDYFDLPAAKQTVQTIAQTLNGKAYINEQANLSNFLKDKENYKILHLSMHGVLNDENPLSSYMAFSPTDNYKLYAYDLYNLKINTDLTILHACNTGAGELQKGEGVMSLSRAFTYAGCPSLVMSLWQIPEKATSEITQSFIKNLQNGLTKDVALQQAKLNYLQNASEWQASPAYWAGLVATGNLEAINFQAY